MDCDLVAEYRQAILIIEGKHYQSAQKKFVEVLKCLKWSTLLTYEWEVAKTFRRELNQMKEVIEFIGLDQKYLEEMCIVRANFVTEDSKTQVFNTIRVLSRYFEKEMKKETDKYYALKKQES
jgi:hypothetical protein